MTLSAWHQGSGSLLGAVPTSCSSTSAKRAFPGAECTKEGRHGPHARRGAATRPLHRHCRNAQRRGTARPGAWLPHPARTGCRIGRRESSFHRPLSLHCRGQRPARLHRSTARLSQSCHDVARATPSCVAPQASPRSTAPYTTNSRRLRSYTATSRAVAFTSRCCGTALLLLLLVSCERNPNDQQRFHGVTESKPCCESCGNSLFLQIGPAVCSSRGACRAAGQARNNRWPSTGQQDSNRRVPSSSARSRSAKNVVGKRSNSRSRPKHTHSEKDTCSGGSNKRLVVCFALRAGNMLDMSPKILPKHRVVSHRHSTRSRVVQTASGVFGPCRRCPARQGTSCWRFARRRYAAQSLLFQQAPVAGCRVVGLRGSAGSGNWTHGKRRAEKTLASAPVFSNPRLFSLSPTPEP